MAEKDELFKNHIAHLMEQVSDLCEEHGIAMMALFETEVPDMYGYACITDDGTQIATVAMVLDGIGDMQTE